MNQRISIATSGIVLCIFAILPHASSADTLDEVRDKALQQIQRNDLAKAREVIEASAPLDELDQETRFLLGMIQYLQATERFSQAMYAHGGLGGRTIILPLPSALGDPNPRPQRISYRIMRAVIEQLRRDMEEIELTLAGVDGEEWKLVINAFDIRLDLDGDGSIEDEESLASVVGRTLGVIGARPIAAEEIAFDQADVHWFRGQCLLISAICDFVYAHEWQEFWNHVAPHSFAETDSPIHDFRNQVDLMGFEDSIAIMHLMSWDLREPERVTRCGDKLHQMVSQLRECFRIVQLETDDDREWIPSPEQTSVVRTFKTTYTSIENVDSLFDQFEKLLSGEELLPPLRSAAERVFQGKEPGTLGINVRQYFENPVGFDLILLVQGSRASPYVEEGNINNEFWVQLISMLISGDLRGLGLDL